MSFLNIRGEMIHCKKCGAVCTIEYQGGPQLTQIGDFYVAEQMKLTKKFMRKYNAEQEGYYYHRVAICQKCLEEKRRADLFSNNHILFKYVNEINELTDFKSGFCSGAIYDFEQNISDDLLKAVNPQEFLILKSTKHFGIKKEKRRIAEKYVENSKHDIYNYIRERFDAEIKPMQNEILKTENDLSMFLRGCGQFIEGFELLDTKSERNLHPFLCYEATLRMPETEESDRDFYIPFKYSKEEIENIVKDSKKFECTLKEDDLISLFERLPLIISKKIL